ncbi:upf0041 domain containing protein [Grosmannia clavigera kw1407]|uniref:Mitochondrial pyruvate carrier n=1 Tax=Grosmannia clavigera (strain kw1407 / UAMH 11150) TaxID=655863 RepID=F0XQL7_GROCL|nr:upf0041 domain containing protein [Grosmannia clavigera kw1407]EFW99904.1 upf0041 domain containing protein [Grosmannia clavigera kw1407]
MAALVKAVNAKIRSNPYVSYFCSTHFWGPASNFGIPVAAVMDTQKSPDLISGKMTFALVIYSATFMRYAMAVQPANYLLFACHFVNEGAQLTQFYRYLNYNNWDVTGKSGNKSVPGVLEAAQAKVADAVKK